MGVKKYKPTSPGRRHGSVDFCLAGRFDLTNYLVIARVTGLEAFTAGTVDGGAVHETFLQWQRGLCVVVVHGVPILLT